MSTSSPSVDPALHSDIAPSLDAHGGAANLVNAKIDAEAGLASNPSADNIASQADRNLSVENALDAAEKFKASHEAGDPADKQKKLAEKMAGSFNRMTPQQVPYSDAETLARAIKQAIEGVAKMLKSLFGSKSDDATASPGSSGYGPEYDDILDKLAKSSEGFEDHAKTLKKEEELAADADNDMGPPPPSLTK